MDSHSEFRTLSNRLTNAFADPWIGRGDRVTLAASRPVETPLVHLAVWKFGGVSVPPAPQFGPDALEYTVLIDDEAELTEAELGCGRCSPGSPRGSTSS